VLLLHIDNSLGCNWSRLTLAMYAMLHLRTVHHNCSAEPFSNVPVTTSHDASLLLLLLLLLLSLQVCGAKQAEFTLDAAPGQALAQLTALQQLQLSDIARFSPDVLSNPARLTRLEIEAIQFEDEDVRALLRMLPGMQQLQHLSLWRGGIESSSPPSPLQLDADQRLLLLSPSKLATLELQHIVLPPSADNIPRAVLEAASKLQSLRAFSLTFSTSTAQLGHWTPLTEQHLGFLVSAMQHLQQLDITGAVAMPESGQADEACWLQLRRLTSLTSLTMFGGPLHDGAVVRALSGMTGLRELAFLQDPNWPAIAVDDVMHLTHLTALTGFSTIVCNSSRTELIDLQSTVSYLQSAFDHDRVLLAGCLLLIPSDPKVFHSRGC
jgi:hypothetical protein